MNRTELTLKKRISHSDQGQYITLPFHVQKNVEEVAAELSFSRPGENVIDLGLEDAEGFRGWSGGARQSIYLREDRATPGYTLGPLPDGEWGVILNAYKVPDACDIEVKVTMQYGMDRWFKGDLHVHSNHSDGVFTVEEVIDQVKNAGLQFVALTDHNTFSQNFGSPSAEGVAVIPGVELTTNRGHCNFYGIPKPFRDFRSQTATDVRKIIEEGLAKGAIVSLNHPHCRFCWWDWGLEQFDVGVVEIWNGPWSEQNAETVGWWDGELKKGRKVTAIGGSDTHRPNDAHTFGVPTNWIYAKMLSPRKLLEGLAKGRVCIASGPEAPWVDLRVGGCTAGETYFVPPGVEELQLNMEMREAVTGGRIKVITDQGVVAEEEGSKGQAAFSFGLPADSQYIRVEVWDSSGKTPIVFSNPIYFSGSEG